jgi:hypothetical protein
LFLSVSPSTATCFGVFSDSKGLGADLEQC